MENEKAAAIYSLYGVIYAIFSLGTVGERELCTKTFFFLKIRECSMRAAHLSKMHGYEMYVI
jgi:hypothetical protein